VTAVSLIFTSWCSAVGNF